MFFFISVKGNKIPVTRNIVFFTGKDPSVTDTPFVTVSFLVTCVYILSCDRKCSFYYKKYSFLVKFGSSYSCIPFLQQMCGIYNQNFLWDIRISWEPGSLVPRDYPTLVSAFSCLPTAAQSTLSDLESSYLSWNKRWHWVWKGGEGLVCMCHPINKATT